MDVKLLDRLAAPVTGIMGATYPKHALAKDADTIALRPGSEEDAEGAAPAPFRVVMAGLAGEPVRLVRKGEAGARQRRLASATAGDLPQGGIAWGPHY